MEGQVLLLMEKPRHTAMNEAGGFSKRIFGFCQSSLSNRSFSPFIRLYPRFPLASLPFSSFAVCNMSNITTCLPASGSNIHKAELPGNAFVLPPPLNFSRSSLLFAMRLPKGKLRSVLSYSFRFGNHNNGIIGVTLSCE